MAYLSKPTKYDIEDTNIALLGSDIERRVREESGEQEPAWADAGRRPGLQIWRIERFHVVPWPTEKYGQFYDGDSYIVLHTYKRSPEDGSLHYDLHFWLGTNTSQDEAGTAAYKTVELDDFLGGKPIQYREVQGYESRHFLSYFPHFMSLRGGSESGFRHVEPETPSELNHLYQIATLPQTSRRRFDTHAPSPSPNITIRQVSPTSESLNKGDVFVLDRGTSVLQFNTRASSGKEKFAAAEFTRKLIDGRDGQAELIVYGETEFTEGYTAFVAGDERTRTLMHIFSVDEGGSGASLFLSALGIDALPPKEDVQLRRSTSLYRLSDSTGTLSFDLISPYTRSSLSSDDAFLVDALGSGEPAIFVWIGKRASLQERRLAVQYAQNYLYSLKQKRGVDRVSTAVPIVKLAEGDESSEFWDALDE